MAVPLAIKRVVHNEGECQAILDKGHCKKCKAIPDLEDTRIAYFCRRHKKIELDGDLKCTVRTCGVVHRTH